VKNFKKYFGNLLNGNTDQNSNNSPYGKLVQKTIEIELSESSMNEVHFSRKKLIKHQEKTT